MKGSYSLIIKTPDKAEIGALGLKEFEKEYTVYNGSAFGPGGLKRVLRHFSNEKNIHWHIDYLLNNGEVVAALIFPGKDLECFLSSKIDGEPVKEFGCSDCGCGSHLFQYDSLKEILAIGDMVSEVKILDRNRYNEYEDDESQRSVEDFIRDLPDPETYEKRGEMS